jgi:hypothetical protein
MDDQRLQSLHSAYRGLDLLALLMSRICVRPPYFALRDLGWSGGLLSATATAESSRTLEDGPMRAAELGRHGAIAGLCAAALSQGERATRNYYLAQRADYRGYPSRAAYGAPVRFNARVIDLGKRQVRALVQAVLLDAPTEPLMEVEVAYAILAETTFERVFRHRRQPTQPSTRFRPLSAREVATDGLSAVSSFKAVPLEVCAGHFDNYPALPVAVALGEMCRVAGALFGRRHFIPEATIEAEDLCWAGERVEFSASRVQDAASDCGLAATADAARFSCMANAEGRAIGRTTFTLIPTDSV